METRAATHWLLFALLLSFSALVAAHPGHEYHVEGVITKLRTPHFEVEDPKSGMTSFMMVPGTEVFLNGSRATTNDITVGMRAEVDGVENERGLVEAKKVSLKR